MLEVPTKDLVALFTSNRHDFDIFMRGVVSYLGEHPTLNFPGQSVIHSYKSRLKDPWHLEEKIERKRAEGRTISPENFFTSITDLAGVRILHLYQGDYALIDKVIRKRVSQGDWVLAERPKAYTWDPEAVLFFKNFDLDVSEKSTSYTSVHYLVRPRADSPICCEIQVRTLFEEIWGEVDHRINYPKASESVACQEQLKVLSKIVGAGSRLLDALDRINKHEVGEARSNIRER